MIKSAESVLRPEESLRWGKICESGIQYYRFRRVAHGSVSHLVAVVDFAVELFDEHHSQVAVGVREGVVSDAQSERSVGRSQLVARHAVATRVRVDGGRHGERAADGRRLGQLVHEPLLREPRPVVVHVDYLDPHLRSAAAAAHRQPYIINRFITAIPTPTL